MIVKWEIKKKSKTKIYKIWNKITAQLRSWKIFKSSQTIRSREAIRFQRLFKKTEKSIV
jgi:hypothetical protein